MADNLNVTAGSGSTIGMDEVVDGTLGTVKVGFGKIMDGTLDSTNKLVVDSTGALSNNTTEIGGTAIDTNSGTKSAGTQRVVLATDQPQLTNALKVDGSAVTQPVSGTLTGITNVVHVDDNAGSLTVDGTVGVTVTDTAPATQNITAQDASSSTTAGANSQSIITGTPTANSAASFSLSSQQSLAFQITGTWTGTLQSEISFDGGTTWYIRGFHQSGTTYTVASVTANAQGHLNVSTATHWRLRATAAMTGTATVKISESLNPSSMYLANSATISDATTPSQKLAINASGQISASNLPTTVDTNSGAKSASTIRSVLATDQPAISTAGVFSVKVDQTTDGTTNKVYANNAQIGGNTINTGSGTAGTGTQRVILATDQTLTNNIIPGQSVSTQTALTTTATVSGAAGRFHGGSFINLNSAPAYIQVFDTTGAVTLGTTTPTFVQPIPAASTAANGIAYVFNITGGITMANGIKVAATTTATGASTVATALIGYITYK